MAGAVQYRKVLALNDDAPMRRFLTLTEKLVSENAVDWKARPLLAAIDRTKFDTGVFDIRCSDRRPGG